MKLVGKSKKIKLWGNHIDPEVSAETYLNSKNVEVKKWANENEEQLQLIDKETINLYRSHRNNCDLRNVEEVETVWQAGKKSAPPPSRNAYPKDPSSKWIEEIYTEKPQDLHKLVTDDEISCALKNLTKRQKQIVHMSAIKQMKSSEIATELGITSRGVRDILQRAYSNIRQAVGNNRGSVATKSIEHSLISIISLVQLKINKTYCKLKKSFLKTA